MDDDLIFDILDDHSLVLVALGSLPLFKLPGNRPLPSCGSRGT